MSGPVMNSAVMNSSVAIVPTVNGSRYLQQLLKHWSHNFTVTVTPAHGTVVFPRDIRGADYPADARGTFDAGAEALTVKIEASSPEQLAALKGAISTHLDRFAFREAPLPFDWQDAD